jgi:uncharacterized protein YabE (DUF348 family)
MRKKLQAFQKRFRRTHATKIDALKQLHKHPVAIPVATFLALAAITVGAFLLFNGGSPKFKPISAYIVIVSHDHTQQTVPTNELTVAALLTKLNIRLNQGDVVEPSLSTRITQDNFRINVYRAVPVEIINDGQATFTFSAATTPRAVAQQAGITVYPEDIVTEAPVNNFAAAQTISKQVIIEHATPINLNIYGTPTTTRTHAKTIGELLTDKKIKLGVGDSIQPTAATPITPNMQIFLLHKGMQIIAVQQTIPMPVQTIQDNSLTFGTSAIRQQGSAGQEVLTYQVDASGNRILIQTVIIQPAVQEIIAEGQAVQIPTDKTSVMAAAGISAGDYAYVNYIVSNESGWCPTKAQGQIGYCPSYAPASVPPYGGYGLGQATPGSKMASFGSDWETNPVTQLRWATSYALGRYGSWAAAYSHWQADHNW